MILIVLKSINSQLTCNFVLQMRQHDGEENVRFEVVKAIVATAKNEIEIVSESEDLLNYVKERTLDKKVRSS